MSFLALKPFKTIVKQYYPGHVSKEYVTIIRDFLEEITVKISKESIQQFHTNNNLRKYHGLPVKKRLDKAACRAAFPIVLDNLYKKYSVQHLTILTTRTIGQGGKKMPTDKKVIKSTVTQNTQRGTI